MSEHELLVARIEHGRLGRSVLGRLGVGLRWALRVVEELLCFVDQHYDHAPETVQ
jgi:hypothetical protein